jgi:hypothetical protein
MCVTDLIHVLLSRMLYFADILSIIHWILLNYQDISVEMLSKSFILCLLGCFIGVVLNLGRLAVWHIV